jgi:hypothetical protein
MKERGTPAMTTEQQAQANRENAGKSTGPQTDTGKAVVRFNALRHGASSRSLILPGEDANALAALADAVERELQPVGTLETALACRVAVLLWRLWRIDRAEAAVLTWLHLDGLTLEGHPVSAGENAPVTAQDEAEIGSAYLRASTEDVLEKLDRHQSTVERSFCRTLETLRELQHERRTAGRLATDGGNGFVLQKTGESS